jgi:ATP-dependent DNA helicase RecG
LPKITIFISSVQSEFAAERRMLADYLQHDALFRKFCEVFIFEDIPAQDRTANDLYLEEVQKSDVYIGLFGKQYGFEFEDGTSPTEREYDCATAHNKYRLIYLSDADAKERNPGMNRLIEKASNELVYSKFSSPSELLSEVYSSLVNYLVKNGKIRIEPFDKSKNEEVTLKDISEEKIRWFVEKAREERAFPLAVNASKEKVLTHLNLINDKNLTNAAVLLFGKQPQRFFISSEIKCAHFHGTKVIKPIPFYQVYKGNLFELVDQAVNFVLSKIDYAVGTRATGTQPPTAYEIPPAVIEEAVVNAVAHRDYDSTGSVQVMLFADRLEIRNPGNLPPALSIEKLTKDHSSYPFNPLIAEALYLARYIERMGTGIQDMMQHCIDAGLPPPEFKIEDAFVVTIRRKKESAFETVGGLTGGAIGGQIGGQISGQISGQIGETQLKILNLIIENQYISRNLIANYLSINESAIQKHLERLKQLGILVRIGGTRGYWEIKKNEQESN